MDPSWTPAPGVHHGHYMSIMDLMSPSWTIWVHHGRYGFTMDTISHTSDGGLNPPPLNNWPPPILKGPPWILKIWEPPPWMPKILEILVIFRTRTTKTSLLSMSMPCGSMLMPCSNYYTCIVLHQLLSCMKVGFNVNCVCFYRKIGEMARRRRKFLKNHYLLTRRRRFFFWRPKPPLEKSTPR